VLQLAGRSAGWRFRNMKTGVKNSYKCVRTQPEVTRKSLIWNEFFGRLEICVRWLFVLRHGYAFNRLT
jgi:hypothetical protein